MYINIHNIYYVYIYVGFLKFTTVLAVWHLDEFDCKRILYTFTFYFVERNMPCESRKSLTQGLGEERHLKVGRTSNHVL